MTGEAPKYKVFFPMKMYHVLFLYLYITCSTNNSESWLYLFRSFHFLQQRHLFREAHHSSSSFWLVSKEFSANAVILPGLSDSKADRWCQ